MKRSIAYNIIIKLLFLLKNVQGGGDAKILYGRKASIRDYAYVVSMSFLNGTHICGGSIIASYHILTACHCTSVNDTGYLVTTDPETLLVKAGSDNIKSPSESYQERRVSVIVPHPKCRIIDAEVIYDVSFLILKNPLEFNRFVHPIRLPFSLLRKKDFVDVSQLCHLRLYCKIAGWGQSEEKSTSEVLQEIAIPLTPSEGCNVRVIAATDGKSHLDSSEICADIVEGKDTCLGDSGSGLRCGKFLIGIVSWGFHCGNDGLPSIFTNVLKVKSFFREVVNKYRNSSSSTISNLFIIIIINNLYHK